MEFIRYPSIRIYAFKIYTDIGVGIIFISSNVRLDYIIVNTRYLNFPSHSLTILNNVATTILTSMDGRHYLYVYTFFLVSNSHQIKKKRYLFLFIISGNIQNVKKVFCFNYVPLRYYAFVHPTVKSRWFAKHME